MHQTGEYPDGRGVSKKSSDIRVCEVTLYFQPVELRVPLRFGGQTVTAVTFARACVTVENRRGTRAAGWGESPLNAAWAWPSQVPYETRTRLLERFCITLAERWRRQGEGARTCGGVFAAGHAIELGYRFIEHELPVLWRALNAEDEASEPMPWLAALICSAPFDLAIHDAFGVVNDVPTYRTYGPQYMNYDLSEYFLDDAPPAAPPTAHDAPLHAATFRKKYPEHYLSRFPAKRLDAWHLVGAKDSVESAEPSGDGLSRNDGYPITLPDWIRRDGLRYLKIKLCGVDWEWDYHRVVRIGTLALAEDVYGLGLDFNCTVREGSYVCELLDRVASDFPQLYERILYVEQPFPVDFASHDPSDVAAIAARKPVFVDESADDWRSVCQARSDGWTGVALKSCKTQTGALLALAWARSQGMELMVQDLSNAMLAQIPHVLLAAYADTGLGVESNGMQYYPDVSTAEARVHPGLYRRRAGRLDLGSLRGAGFGYRIIEIERELPSCAYSSFV
ncbi:MAG: enolase C-terminal domain-like protein [Spirochaetota bacterium]